MINKKKLNEQYVSAGSFKRVSEGPFHLTYREEGLFELWRGHKELSLWIAESILSECLVGLHERSR